LTGRLAGKVVLVTGAARGQGAAHVRRMAEEGADVIALDLLDDIATNPYPLARQIDIDAVAAQVEALGRRIVVRQADVRDRAQLEDVVSAGLDQLGRLDVVVANAGICPMRSSTVQAFVDAIDVDLVGVINTVATALPHLRAGASIVITGSTAGLMTDTTDAGDDPGGSGYALAKRLLVSYTEKLATQLGPLSIRANVIHPTNCNTALLHQDAIYRAFRPDLDAPTREDAELAFTYYHSMPIPFIEPEDVAELAVFLASDAARYITGQQIRVDAGALLKSPSPS
jgi:SDR family mycofactocin-dependent oxidoreductase